MKRNYIILSIIFASIFFISLVFRYSKAGAGNRESEGFVFGIPREFVNSKILVPDEKIVAGDGIIFNELEKKGVIIDADKIERKEKKIILYEVPFSDQAPLGNWDDEIQKEACEETSALMAMLWVKGELDISKENAQKEILAISNFELEKYGTYKDTSASDTIQRILIDYFSYHQAVLKDVEKPEDIIVELEAGNLLIVPINGRTLGGVYPAPGPERHMLVIIGYDYNTKEFISNDPGVACGKLYRYKQDALFLSIRDYLSGEDLPIIKNRKNMIVISK